MNTFFPPPFPGMVPPGGDRPPGFGARGPRRGGADFRDPVGERHPGFGPGPGFGAGFGPGFGFGPPGAGFGFGPGPRGGRRGHGRRGHGRGRRGDVRAAILLLLAERPMHGYEMIQQIAERSQELWRPSPGSVYPTLQLLTDEGLITAAESSGSKRLFTLTDDGQEAAAAIATPPWEEITEGADPTQVSLRNAVGQLFGAVAQGSHAADAEQQQRILGVLNAARRDIYTILGESD
ncbi:helix-turn-helix transcriptional regulator [Mycolicibacillus parakoreensis]|uniref:PadR family transcriptional regulator n=1 Tax=Mycolicibacillus parakoreensis TaxID=1069221 RepID=A0ABY3U2L4_9MYCO|nr:PadR family transcriptional regulator [Mycolicibacillus parakoreensis]MCV7314195.1 helix-turn-helix transcriptional regulator [Mycolicibacillus parakoreensis]ULN52911.1 PadR family transcriptional regulator [Mycolicibacillus parakoreensis]